MPGFNVTAVSVSVPETAERIRSASKRVGDRSYLALLLALSALVMGTLAVLHDQFVLLAGDEPHYLIISQALELYHSIDVQRVYDAANYHAFYPWPLPAHIAHGPDGQSFPWHGIGGPVLWLLPFVLAGRAGVSAFMVIVSLLIVANVFLLARALGVGPRTAFAVGLAFAIGTPILNYSSLVFVEPIGALGCVYALRLLHTPTLRTRDLLLVSTCLGVLPWVHARFLLFPPLFLAFLLLRLRRDGATRRRVLAALLPALLLIAGFEAYNLIVWHTLSPAPNQVSIGAVPFQKNPLPGLIGTVMDPGIGVIPNFPIFLLVLPGILLTTSRRWWPLHIQIAALVLPYTLMVCTFTFWDGGWAPPARFAAVVLPMLSGYVALALQRAPLLIVRGFAVAAAIYACALTTAAIFTPHGGFTTGASQRPGLPPMFTAWAAATIGVAAAVWLLGRRQQQREDHTIATA
jgi:hypothetical protein